MWIDVEKFVREYGYKKDSVYALHSLDKREGREGQRFKKIDGKTYVNTYFFKKKEDDGEYSFKEIADFFGISEGFTVKLYHRAMAKILIILEEKNAVH